MLELFPQVILVQRAWHQTVQQQFRATPKPQSHSTKEARRPVLARRPASSSLRPAALPNAAAGARPRALGHARAGAGSLVPPPRRRLPSSGLCCNVCEADFERLARRPPAAALLPPPPSPPRPGPSPRRCTPFSSSAKFLNPFFPLLPIVTGREEAARVPAAHWSRAAPSVVPFSSLLVLRMAGRGLRVPEAAGGRRRPGEVGAPRAPAVSLGSQLCPAAPDSRRRRAWIALPWGPGRPPRHTGRKLALGHRLGAGTHRVPAWMLAPEGSPPPISPHNTRSLGSPHPPPTSTAL